MALKIHICKQHHFHLIFFKKLMVSEKRERSYTFFKIKCKYFYIKVVKRKTEKFIRKYWIWRQKNSHQININLRQYLFTYSILIERLQNNLFFFHFRNPFFVSKYTMLWCDLVISFTNMFQFAKVVTNSK